MADLLRLDFTEGSERAWQFLRARHSGAIYQSWDHRDSALQRRRNLEPHEVPGTVDPAPSCLT